MAIKTYTPQYVYTYEYKDPATGETDRILFKANGQLFPLFKSYAGIELEVALNSYTAELIGSVTDETVKVMAEFDAATDADSKLKAAMNNPNELLKMLRIAGNTHLSARGLSLIELLLIVMHVCALPEDEQSEALSYGIDLLPQEVYEDPTTAFAILEIALNYNSYAKKKSASALPKQRAQS